MKKAALVLALAIVSVSCLQSKAWSKPSLLLQLPPMLASLKNSDTTQIVIGDDGLVQAFKGKLLKTDIKIFDGYMLADREGYTYSIANGPANLTVSAEGVIEYDIATNAETALIPFVVLIKNKTTGKTYSENVQIAILETEVVASENFGPEGGQAADEFDDVVLTVPPDTFIEQAFVEVLRAVDKEGYYAYTIRSSAPMLKVAQLRLPDPILRKAPEGSSVMLQSRKLFQQAQAGEQPKMREEENGWVSWQKWSARYVEITTGFNVQNRLRSDLSEKSEPAHKYVNNIKGFSSELFSLCKKEPYDCGEKTSEKTPVLFIHGYTGADWSWKHKPGLGGGEDTWGKLPELIKAKGYAVFEFTWKTNARFADAAADFAEAIGLIQEISGKKVHIVAHSFGGLVSRAYLQNYATGRPYQNNVQSLLTLGTPHSGIFDGDGTYHGLFFKKGQDSSMFEGCMQISCHEAGEPTPEAYTIDPLFGDNIEINDSFGIDKNQGGFIAQIQNTSGKHGLPVDTLALIGLPIGLPTNIKNYKTGDNLITYAGQRFNRTWENENIKLDAQSDFGSGEVHEKILGVSDYDKNAIPKGKPSDELVELWSKNNFKGYSHASFVMDIGGATEANVNIDDSLNFRKTNAPHAALAEIKAWLKPSDDAEQLSVNLHLQVIDTDTQFSVSFAAVYFNINEILSCSSEQYGVTDGNGNLNKRIIFHPSSKYTALVIADGYRSEGFDTGYTTGLTPALSGTEFGTIRLQKRKVPTVTSATGRVWMDRNLGASRVAMSMTDTQAYGDLYQWGRLADGHEKRTSDTTATVSSTDVPGHGNFILPDNGPDDWRSQFNNNLWQGVHGINNPCPAGFRLPTATEWREEIKSWISQDDTGAFSSPIKLVTTNYRSNDDGKIYELFRYGDAYGMIHEVRGGYWSSTIDDWKAKAIFSYDSDLFSMYRSDGLSVRCIKDIPLPPVENPKTVTSKTGRVWLDRNLGASRVAVSVDDELALGDLYQWGRFTDGHEKRTSGISNTMSSSDIPGHDNHIVVWGDWRDPQNNNLWQGVNGINNPCPAGFRLPTTEEWQQEINSWSSLPSSAGAFSSPLKLIRGGYRSVFDGLIRLDGFYYWSNNIIESTSYIEFYMSEHLYSCIHGTAYITNSTRGKGMSVRCIKD